MDESVDMPEDEDAEDFPPGTLSVALAIADEGLAERETILALEAARFEGWRVDDRAQAKGLTALMLAAQCGKDGVIDWLLAEGANPALVNATGRNALTFAAIYGHAVAVACLADACSHASEDPTDGPLSLAVKVGYLPLAGLGFLIERAPSDALAWTLDFLAAEGQPALRDGKALELCRQEWARRESLAMREAIGEAGVKKGAAPRI